jgi:hypothetical protein
MVDRGHRPRRGFYERNLVGAEAETVGDVEHGDGGLQWTSLISRRISSSGVWREEEARRPIGTVSSSNDNLERL